MSALTRLAPLALVVLFLAFPTVTPKIVRHAEWVRIQGRLASEDAHTRRRAVLDTPEFGDDAAPLLMALVREDDDRMTRKLSLYALSHLPVVSRPVVDTLVEATNDEGQSVRTAALQALQNCKESAAAAVPSLTRILEDRSRSWRDRHCAAVALREVGGASAVPALTAALNDPDRRVRRAVRRSLREVEGQAAEGLLPHG
jgi:hypothetical protein